MDRGISLQFPKERVAVLNLKSVECSRNFHPYFFNVHFFISHLCLGLPSGLFPSGFQTKILYVISHPVGAIHFI
jgi:hypothetical protein